MQNNKEQNLQTENNENPRSEDRVIFMLFLMELKYWGFSYTNLGIRVSTLPFQDH